MSVINWHPGVSLANLEKQAILITFRFFKGNKTQTARALDIAVRTLDAKLEQYQVQHVDEEAAKNERKRKGDEFLRRQRGLSDEDSIRIANGDYNERQVSIDPRGKRPQGPTTQSITNGHAEHGTESTEGTSGEHAVSVQVGKKVQSVPPKSIATSGNKKDR